jgi:hypothetical protein
MILSVVYFFLVINSALAWFGGCARNTVVVGDKKLEKRHGVQVVKKRHVAGETTMFGNIMLNRWCPAEPDCTKAHCNSCSSMCLILRGIMFFTIWGLFIGSTVQEFNSFSFGLIWNTLPRNFALMWTFLFTLAGGLIDLTAMMVVCLHLKSPYNRGCSLRCPLRQPDDYEEVPQAGVV